MPHIRSRAAYFRRRQHFVDNGYIKPAKSGYEKTKWSDASTRNKRDITADGAKSSWAGAPGCPAESG
eukprot:11184851-Karenia_brevis.AAC.1